MGAVGQQNILCDRDERNRDAHSVLRVRQTVHGQCCKKLIVFVRERGVIHGDIGMLLGIAQKMGVFSVSVKVFT